MSEPLSPEVERLLALFQHVQQVPSDERTALSDTVREQVRTLEVERDVERAMRVERDGLLAGYRERQAIHEDAVAQAVRERDEARAKAAIWEKAASLARDAALKEAEQRITASKHILAPLFAEEVRALKSQPARRFVDAEQVRQVLLSSCDLCCGRGDYLPSCSLCSDSGEDHECPPRRKCGHAPLRTLFERLGLTLDGEKP